MKYRREIDGLRALAVLPVVFFHADLAGVTGGYIGVDIFFVISGYLITATILEQISANKFSIADFYERRARRILPALSLVLFFTSVAAFILMPPVYLKTYSQSLVSAVTFSSNVFFTLTGGYFSTASDERPLLHLWSLAVEEQFYIVFPILLSGLWFLGKKRLMSLMLLLLIASLSFAQYLISINAATENFYSIFSRAWELLAGALLAMAGMRAHSINKPGSDLLGGLGIALIAYSIFVFDNHTPFPSLYTILPVSGTLLILAFSDSTTFIGRVLAQKILVGIGLISYSLYLWHQPLFAFIRIKTNGDPNPHLFLLAILIALCFSVLSYKMIETPFRAKGNIGRKRMIQFSILSTFIFLIVGLSGHLFDGYKERFNSATYLKFAQASPMSNRCHTSGLDYLKPVDACRYLGKNVTWASLGDSHAVEPSFALAELLKSQGKGVLHLSFSACPPALLFDSGRPGCTKWLNESLEYLVRDREIENVFLGFRYRVFQRAFQLNLHTDSNVPAEKIDGRELLWQSLVEIIRRLETSGKNVYLLYPTPELPMHIARAATPFSIFGGRPLLDLTQTISASNYNTRNEFILNKLSTLNYHENLHAIKPFELLCYKEYCPAVVKGKALYYDDHHLSVVGAKLIMSKSGILDN